MVLFMIVGVIVLLAIVVLGFLFYMLSQEGQKKEEEKAVPLTDLDMLKKELSTGLLEPQKPKSDSNEYDIIPAFVPKASITPEPVQLSLEDVVYKKRSKELEEELRGIAEKADGQSQEAQQLIETLTQENESLKRQKEILEESQRKLIEVREETVSLKAENAGLQTQLETTNAKVQLLEEQMAAFKIQMGEEIARANAVVSELSREKEALLSAPTPDPDEAVRQELETLKSEQIQLKQKYADLEMTHQKLSDLNAQLNEKVDLLQYELIKARAQSSGLERVSFNYKNQLEDFLKKVNAAQVTNEHLSQVKNRLEGMVEQVKMENDELIKKDQLTQFELEKNRTRLINLEREYEDLKARVQQQDR